MAATSYLPAKDADRVIWMNNFKTKIAQHGSTFGFTPAEITGFQNDGAFFQYVVQQLDANRQNVIALTSYRNQLKNSVQPLPALPTVVMPATVPTAVPAGIFKRVATAVVRIKNHANYTTSIGQEFQILVPAPQAPNPATWQPSLTITLDAGRPKLKWLKGSSDGIVLYVDRGDGNGFVELNKVSGNSYIDGTDLPANQLAATWTYYARYLFDFVEVGQASQSVTINVVKQ